MAGHLGQSAHAYRVVSGIFNPDKVAALFTFRVLQPGVSWPEIIACLLNLCYGSREPVPLGVTCLISVALSKAVFKQNLVVFNIFQIL